MRNKDVETGAGSPVEVETPLGTLRGKYQLKAACQSAAFVCLIACYGVIHLYQSATGAAPLYADDAAAPAPEEEYSLRWLQSANNETEAPVDPCDGLSKADPGWLCAFYAIGVLYMFLALAIACDEFFVPALEEMSSPRRLNLSMDVAGATLMAAGGSAPELFTSLFGTFQESSIGFGTIVGSAVFNVLFVIAMCSMLANEVLNLTWWPLFRDSFYYAIGLVVLSIFVGVTTPNEIVLWESCVLFVMYIGYIILMWQNANLYTVLTGKVLEYPDEDEGGDDAGNNDNNKKDENDDKKEGPSPENNAENDDKKEGPSREVMQKSNSRNSILSNLSARALDAQGLVPQSSPHFRWQGTFRAGILKLLKDPDSWMDTAGIGIVAKIAGDADYVFQQVDMDGNGHVDREELKQLFNLLECYIGPSELEEVFNTLDLDKDGTVSEQQASIVTHTPTLKEAKPHTKLSLCST